ncbi:MAG: S-adenosylmethionine decarboxylase [Nitrospinota bacterium]
MEHESNKIGEVGLDEAIPYGFELILDLHDCNPTKFTREDLDLYFTRLCDLIDMEKCEVHFWDDEGVPPEQRQTSPHTKGTSAVCFILTSSIVVHTLDDLKAVYVNIFSCKEFDPAVAMKFTEEWFEAGSCKPTFIKRL